MKATANPSTLYCERNTLNSSNKPLGAAGGAGGAGVSSLLISRSSARICSSTEGIETFLAIRNLAVQWRMNSLSSSRSLSQAAHALLSQFRCILHRFDYVHIPSAPAEIARECFPDHLLVRVSPTFSTLA